ncbi:hypothetical protein [Poritiphilus flavus]|uniref:Uncharacterized protein n=1 Tax=Poritiphilus flavus TaxID=2697053 RepID=A0A6L9EG67_9FLAO|nr:hypothetical protein [Poritiphilus flavus]NAS13646.1 hypothetical protein [Poritiphilus flavus]
MKTAEYPSRKDRDTMPMILRLERNNSQILCLKDKLSSYVCEPKTLSLFEHMESLKSRLERMRNSNLEVISMLKDQKKALEIRKENIVNRFKEFKELEDNVFEYIGMARMHC